MGSKSKRYFSKAYKNKAVDQLIWLNFKHRNDLETFKLVLTNKLDFSIHNQDFDPSGWGLNEIRRIRRHYRKMKYSEIETIASDAKPLNHWEMIRGMISTQDGELLRFMVKYQIPLERFIRYELASRGLDENHKWVGFDKAKKIWLK